MELIHDVMNILVPLVVLIFLILFYPPYLVYKLLSFIKRSITTEDVRGKVVVITGASSGIGEHIAYEYAKRGARLVLAARREDRLLAVADKALKLGCLDVKVIRADVAKVEDCKRLIEEALNYFGRLDHLVNNAGIERHSLFEEINQIADFIPIMDINFWGSAYCTHFAVPHLKKTKGKIVVIASTASWSPTPGLNIYNASKAAQTSFFETLRTEFGGAIGVTIVLPGVIESEMANSQTLAEIGLDILPSESTGRCAKAIVNSACRGDMFLTEPFWVGVGYLQKVLCSEFTEWQYHKHFVKKLQKHHAGKKN
ncbi:11-beta-hydroxysteroid dehydrogenase-like 4A [Tripterygium wilfordii]|uniref:11-beta-hydroxysteroid dehydrogenase-like 4A n=1 Tax=Tripterygium wilfordii TaxID=458696 RepID=A0A7J7DBP1_TRIWF|nr:11-beta-hydroxysteroid dehydrogenase-like 4A [Tripterygium wilfordii]KAF5743678.1 11-beta-hydroxysteroid dehydrogenase-like 4A [Tripterygium wilfordii]